MNPSPRIVCIGGAVIDRKYRAAAPLRGDTSNPVSGAQAFGGVARNVGEALARLGAAVSLVSVVGDDAGGRALIGHAGGLGIDTAAVAILPGAATAEYVAVLSPDSALYVGLADMAIFDRLTADLLPPVAPLLDAAAWVFADCNGTAELLAALIALRRRSRFRLAIDAVSLAKVARLPADLTGVDALFLNRDEAAAYLGDDAADPTAAALALRRRGADGAVVTVGAGGAIVADASGVVHCPAMACRPIDVTGAGDALIAGTLHGLCHGQTLAAAVRLGCVAAALTTESDRSVRPDLTPERLVEGLARLRG